MKNNKYTRVTLMLITVIFLSAAVMAQDGDPQERAHDPREQMPRRPVDNRMDVFRRLELSAEQIQQIRRLTVARRPLMQEAQKRFRKANKDLDQAIYADTTNESEIDTRLQEVHSAQAEVARIRFMGELEVRKLLTPEQLVRFRELRQAFEERRMRSNNRPHFKGIAPHNRRRRDRKDSDEVRPPAVRPN